MGKSEIQATVSGFFNGSSIRSGDPNLRRKNVGARARGKDESVSGCFRISRAVPLEMDDAWMSLYREQNECVVKPRQYGSEQQFRKCAAGPRCSGVWRRSSK